MSMILSRRSLLTLGTLGAGAAAIPAAAQLARARGFTHSVASGEPGPDRIMLWTRYVPASGSESRLSWQLAESPDFGRIAATGEVHARAADDWCAKAIASGLQPGTRYFYRFVDRRGVASPIGRTGTLPESGIKQFTVAVFSCSNLPFGWFNAYAHAAAQNDIDLVVHLGDYLYEYERGRYPKRRDALPGRPIFPAGETVHLADYRLRFAAYRADRDLQELHRLFPMVAMWDDHESANDSWSGGADNHEAPEGDWQVRKRASVKAYREWMPVSEADWTSYRAGDLAEIFRPETRLRGRDRQLTVGPAITAALRSGQSPNAALTSFRDQQWLDPARTMLGAEQERWLARGLASSVRSGVRWQVLAQQTVMGSILLPTEASGWTAGELSPEARQRIELGLTASTLGLPANYDGWDGYPKARERLLAAAKDAGANLVVLSGDSHNAWAFDLPLGSEAAGVEFAGQSVTSPGLERHLPAVRPDDLVGLTRKRNPSLKWANFDRRGYMTVTFTPGAATSEWLLLDTIRQRSTVIAKRHRLGVTWGSNRLQSG